jgi:hypothetical protein
MSRVKFDDAAKNWVAMLMSVFSGKQIFSEKAIINEGTFQVQLRNYRGANNILLQS